MARVLMLVSSARVMLLRDGRPHETGYFAEEALKPYDRFVAAGAEVIVATPDGLEPHVDPYGLEPYFHYPDEDEDFLASVLRTFMRDADDIRVTLRHLSELDLIAARRIHAALRAAGAPDAAARRIVSRSARSAWSEMENFVELLARDPEATALASPAHMAALRDEVLAESEVISKRSAQRLATLPAFQRPARLGALPDARILELDALFVPGGHGPMVDFANNMHVGRVLRLLHGSGRTICCLCHGPAALLSAGETPDGRWVFDGYKMTSFTDEEEDQTRVGQQGIAWYLETALKNAGAVFDDAPVPWSSHVVVDRNLITSQNPMSSEAAADAVIVRLGLTRPVSMGNPAAPTRPVPQAPPVVSTGSAA